MGEKKHLTDGLLVLALDSSITSIKTIVVDAAGNIQYTAKEGIRLHTPTMDCYEYNPVR